jgi:uncharacterized membrane protein (DUF485 family)
MYNCEPTVTPPSKPLTDWERIDRMPEFRQLLAARRRFIVPACVFFCAYYFALPLLAGWAPELMRRRAIGPVNVAYLFALSQFFMAWIVAILYMRAARGFDLMVKNILEKLK